jgi:hypothetical protein
MHSKYLGFSFQANSDDDDGSGSLVTKNIAKKAGPSRIAPLLPPPQQAKGSSLVPPPPPPPPPVVTKAAPNYAEQLDGLLGIVPGEFELNASKSSDKQLPNTAISSDSKDIDDFFATFDEKK